MVTKAAHNHSDPTRAPLQRDGIVQTALDLMHNIGLDALSLRRLADELHVQAPALYWHFKNKQELLNEMAVAMLTAPHTGQVPPLSLMGDDWETWVRRMGIFMRDALMRYRDGARLLAVAEVSRVSVQFLDASLGMLVRSGFSSKHAMIGIGTIVNYTMGFVFEEQASPRSTDAVAAFKTMIADTDLPYLKTVFDTEQIPGDSSEEFDAGLGLIINGMKANLNL